MRVVVHDYAGHAFTVQLSRELARRGHDVLHLYSGSLSATPQGSNAKQADDPATFHSQVIDLGYVIDRSNLKQVFLRDDVRHAALAMQAIERFRPDVVLSGNTSIRINMALQELCHASGISFVFWVQDLFGEAARRLLKDRWKGLGKYAGEFMHHYERKSLAKSDAIVVIADAFLPHLPPVKCPVDVIENWAPMEEMPVFDKANPWSEKHGLHKSFNFVYSGTMALKHNPELMVKIAEAHRDKPDHRVVVVSSGPGAEYLAARRQELGLDNLVLLPFQPFEELPQVLASADVLVAILEPDASVFSVPSKVLSYLCAGRALLLGVPPENLASTTVEMAGAGIVVDPNDTDGFVQAAEHLATDDKTRSEMASAARAYAENTFDIGSVAAKFEKVFATAAGRKNGAA